jgi:nicotinamide-nucleotide amidase
MEKEKLERLIDDLKQKGLTLAIAESITAGMAISTLADVKGISDVLLGGIISYKKETKVDILGVDPGLLDKMSAESQEVTTAMAQGLKELFRSAVTVAVTGAASEPGEESGYKLKVPVGQVFLTVIFRETIFEWSELFEGGPDEIRNKTVNFIFGKLRTLVERL